IGWAKPVPINPSYFKDQRRGTVYVSLAGPLANFTAAFAAGLIFRFSQNILPHFLLLILVMIVEINIWLGLFNLIPIPPLDGSKILSALLPSEALKTYYSFERYGIILLILLLTVFRDVFLRIFLPLHNLLSYLFVGFA
ncbi:MAG: site-2 protease family protein, partial [Candidatus Subteraquimicrobiales bacterium]|nr:site-2 protease family protein [Candidatus Subteraquimicrobiales bacterium]